MPPTVPSALFLMPWLVTLMRPASVVLIERTYCDVAEVDSQPQAPAAGSAVEDCTTSVMVVRQADAANISSEFLARTV